MDQSVIANLPVRLVPLAIRLWAALPTRARAEAATCTQPASATAATSASGSTKS